MYSAIFECEERIDHGHGEVIMHVHVSIRVHKWYISESIIMVMIISRTTVNSKSHCHVVINEQRVRLLFPAIQKVN